MKIWITRQSASSIWAGGLERLQVWFHRPVYIEEHIYREDDDPFHDPTQGRLAPGHWTVKDSGRIERSSVSFGRVFGRRDSEDKQGDVLDFVSKELHKHFHNRPQEEWDELERKRESPIQAFLLELDLEIRIRTK